MRLDSPYIYVDVKRSRSVMFPCLELDTRGFQDGRNQVRVIWVAVPARLAHIFISQCIASKMLRKLLDALQIAPYKPDEWMTALQLVAEATNSSHGEMICWTKPNKTPLKLISNLSDEQAKLIQDWEMRGRRGPLGQSDRRRRDRGARPADGHGRRSDPPRRTIPACRLERVLSQTRHPSHVLLAAVAQRRFDSRAVPAAIVPRWACHARRTQPVQFDRRQVARCGVDGAIPESGWRSRFGRGAGGLVDSRHHPGRVWPLRPRFARVPSPFVRRRRLDGSDWIGFAATTPRKQPRDCPRAGSIDRDRCRPAAMRRLRHPVVGRWRTSVRAIARLC